MIRKLVFERSNWREYWLSSTIGYTTTLALWLSWNSYDSQTKSYVLSVLNYESGFYYNWINTVKTKPNDPDNRKGIVPQTYQRGFSRDIYDSTVEDNGAAAMFLATYAQMLHSLNYPLPSNGETYEDVKSRAQRIEKAALVYGFHTNSLGELDNVYGYNLKSKTLVAKPPFGWLLITIHSRLHRITV
ncbi:MAG: hypothetical protein QXM52_04785 [Candidatus Bathyarchaeia archaeon]